MATRWSAISNEIKAAGNSYDAVRRGYLKALSDYTGRETVIYVVDFLEPHHGKPGSGTMLDLSDKVRFEEVTRGLKGPALDIVIESPGGYAEAAESIVRLLRSRFADIRFIVPNVAKSAATMLALSGNALVMDVKSELGPTDPQMVFRREGASLMSPAQAILDQFQKAGKEIVGNPGLLPAWMPILNHYAPSLLTECENQLKLAHDLVAEWLEKYMFAADPNGKTKAETISSFFADSHQHLSHGRSIDMVQAKDLGLAVLDMSTDPELNGRVWDLYLAISITFDNTPAVKIVENDLGDCVVLLGRQMEIPVAALQPTPPGSGPQHPVLPLPAGPNRGQRRQMERHGRR